jgi:preprotein translocase subunit YajC
MMVFENYSVFENNSFGLIAQVEATTGPATPSMSPTTGASGTALKPAPGPMDSIVTFAPLILGVILLYFFMFRSKKKQDQERKSLIDGIKKGDEVQTIGGVFGKVVEARDDRVQVKVDETTNTKVWFARSAIHRVVTGEKAEAK